MIELEAAISAVAVYARGARVRRIGRVEVQPDTIDLALRGLPASLAADSVRARGRGMAGARLLGGHGGSGGAEPGAGRGHGGDGVHGGRGLERRSRRHLPRAPAGHRAG